MKLSSWVRAQSSAGRSLRKHSLLCKALHPQVQQVRKGRQETGVAEPGPAGQNEEQEKNVQAVETGAGTVGTECKEVARL